MTLTETDLRERSEQLNKTQDLYEDLAYLYSEKMACPECAGAGAVYGGSLGNICPRCFGTRAVDHPSAERLELPNFAAMRACITAYGDALADGALTDGHKGKRGLLLPPAESVPTLEEIQAIRTAGVEQAAQLREKKVEIRGELAAPEPEVDEFTDGELDELGD